MQDNTDQVAYWNARAGATWAAMQERIDGVFRNITAAAIAAAAPAAGEGVVDVGCGTGATVLELARRVGPTGAVLGVDVSEPMLARARERIEAAHLEHATVTKSDAASHAFPEGGSDLVFSRFGVMFFAEPVAAFANIRRALRPGGRLCFACWRTPADNQWAHLPLEAARDLFPPQPPSDPTAPGPFAFADADRVRAVLGDAGWHDVDLARTDVAMPLSGPGQFDHALEFAIRVGMLARLLLEADDATRERAQAAVAQALRPLDGPDGVTLSGSVWLVSATAP